MSNRRLSQRTRASEIGSLTRLKSRAAAIVEWGGTPSPSLTRLTQGEPSLPPISVPEPTSPDISDHEEDITVHDIVKKANQAYEPYVKNVDLGVKYVTPRGPDYCLDVRLPPVVSRASASPYPQRSPAPRLKVSRSASLPLLKERDDFDDSDDSDEPAANEPPRVHSSLYAQFIANRATSVSTLTAECNQALRNHQFGIRHKAKGKCNEGEISGAMESGSESSDSDEAAHPVADPYAALREINSLLALFGSDIMSQDITKVHRRTAKKMADGTNERLYGKTILDRGRANVKKELQEKLRKLRTNPNLFNEFDREVQQYMREKRSRVDTRAIRERYALILQTYVGSPRTVARNKADRAKEIEGRLALVARRREEIEVERAKELHYKLSRKTRRIEERMRRVLVARANRWSVVMIAALRMSMMARKVTAYRKQFQAQFRFHMAARVIQKFYRIKAIKRHVNRLVVALHIVRRFAFRRIVQHRIMRKIQAVDVIVKCLRLSLGENVILRLIRRLKSKALRLQRWWRIRFMVHKSMMLLLGLQWETAQQDFFAGKKIDRASAKRLVGLSVPREIRDSVLARDLRARRKLYVRQLQGYAKALEEHRAKEEHRCMMIQARKTLGAAVQMSDFVEAPPPQKPFFPVLSKNIHSLLSEGQHILSSAKGPNKREGKKVLASAVSKANLSGKPRKSDGGRGARRGSGEGG
eukprot:Rmarinus@m.19993